MRLANSEGAMVMLIQRSGRIASRARKWGLGHPCPDIRGLWPTHPTRGLRPLGLGAPMPRQMGIVAREPLTDRLERVVLEERAQVLRGGLEVLAGQPDENRLGDLEEATALAPVEAGDLSTAVDRLQRGVDLDVERPAGALGGELLVLGQRDADRGRCVGPAQERSLIEERGPGLQRAVAGDASLG